MGRTAEKVAEITREDASMEGALEFLLEREGPVTWSEVSDELTSGQWGRLIEKGVLTDAGDGFELADPEGVSDALADDDDDGVTEIEDDSSWSTYDKLAALGAVGLFAGYSISSVRNAIGSTIDTVLGPVNSALPFYGVILVLAVFTGLYTSLLQANLMDTDKMAAYQERMKDMKERREQAKEQGDDEALEEIQQEQMEAMGDNLGMFKEQFRPMVWIMLLTIPVFLWMYWMILTQGVGSLEVTMPLLGTVEWQRGVLGPLQAWILWYFVCSMGFSQLIRKSLNLQTTPTT
ncbi:HTR-like protein [Halobacteriales archaeon QH_7_66_36]|nr:MAG: HTR-like protein [Halobacteriales archaeon QH_7_66_36]